MKETVQPYKERRDDLHYFQMSFVAVFWHTVMSWMMKGEIQEKEKRCLDNGEGVLHFHRGFWHWNHNAILTNMFSLWATVLAAPHGCLKYSAKWKRQVNEGVRGFISMVLMSTTPLMCNKQNSVWLPRDFTMARVLMLCVTLLSVFMHNAA